MEKISNREDISRFPVYTYFDKENKIIVKEFKNKDKMERFVKVMDFLYKNDFPVNKILEVDYEKGIVKLEYIEGESLNDIIFNNKISKEEIIKIMKDLADIVFRIHNKTKIELKVPYYIYFRKRYERLLECIKNKKKLYRFSKQLFETVDKEDYYISIVHGDLSLGNIIIRNGKIVGIIDWESSDYMDPLFDISIFDGLNLYYDKDIINSFVYEYLNLANVDYRDYHSLRSIYQFARLLESFGCNFPEEFLDKIIFMIESNGNIDIKYFFTQKLDTNQ